MQTFIQSTEFNIGQKVKNTVTGKTEIVTKVKGGYVNGYRSDLFVMADNAETNNSNNLTSSMLTNICLGFQYWNKKFYGQFIYVNNIKYAVSFEQMEELSRHCETEY